MVLYSPDTLDRVFHALADPTRREMLRSLAAGQRNVGQLAAPFRMSLPAASKHLRVLESAGLVNRTVEGRCHVCSIRPAPLAAAEQWLRFYQRFWNERLDALEALLKSDIVIAPGSAGGSPHNAKRPRAPRRSARKPSPRTRNKKRQPPGRHR